MRVKGGFVTRRRHKKILDMTKGQWGSRSKLFRRANEAMMKSYWYAYRDRRNKKRSFRALWIQRINAAVRLFDPAFTYSRLIDGLGRAGIEVDRKVLADLAVHEPEAFNAIAERARSALAR